MVASGGRCTRGSADLPLWTREGVQLLGPEAHKRGLHSRKTLSACVCSVEQRRVPLTLTAHVPAFSAVFPPELVKAQPACGK